MLFQCFSGLEHEEQYNHKSVILHMFNVPIKSLLYICDCVPQE